jgi:RHS repeat-associated protein
MQRVAFRVGSTLYYVLGDHLGSTSLTTDTYGILVSELRYKPWGETRYTNGTTATNYRYTGQREESSFGLYFYNARWYDSALGRFAQADTIIPGAGNSQAWDRYAYGFNNPLSYSDVSGHNPIPWDELFNSLYTLAQNVVQWWTDKVNNLCSMTIDPNCGYSLPPVSVPDAIDKTVQQYAANNPGVLSPEKIRQISEITDATQRLTALVNAYGDWATNDYGEPFPFVIDPRTGQPIPPPSPDLERIPLEDRVPWGKPQRDAFKSEWESLGYPEPEGGWSLYDIHHIIPKEYGGTNDFWNLVPVIRTLHQQEMNPWWQQYHQMD